MNLATIVVGLKDDTSEGFKSVKRQFGALEAQLSTTKGNLQSFIATVTGFTVAGFSMNWLKDTFESIVKTTAEMERFAQIGGTSVETLSKFGPAAKLTGIGFDSITGAMVKMSRGLAGADDETKGAGRALEFLQIKARDSAGRLRDAGEVTQEVAMKFAMYGDGAGKVALATDLWGKSGAQMIPLLRQMAEMGAVDAKVTAQQAEQARLYEQAMLQLGAAKGAIGKIISFQILPVMTALATGFVSLRNQSGGLKKEVEDLARQNKIQEWAIAAARGVLTVADGAEGLMRVFQVAGKAIGASLALTMTALESAASAAVALWNLMLTPTWDFTRVKANMDALKSTVSVGFSRMKSVASESGDEIRSALAKPFATAGMRTQLDLLEAGLLKTGKAGQLAGAGYTNASNAADALTKSYENAMRAQEQQQAQLELEIESLQKYGVETQATNQVRMQVALRYGELAKLSQTMKDGLLQESAKTDSLTLAKKALADNLKGEAEGRKAVLEAQQKGIDAYNDVTLQHQGEIDRLQFEARMIGLTREQVSALTAARQIDLQVREAIAKLPSDEWGGYDEAALNRIRAAGEESKARITALIASNEVAKAGFENTVAILKNADDGARSFFGETVSGALKAGDAFKRLGNQIKTSVFDLMYQLTARPFIISIAASLTGMSAAGLAQAAGISNATAGGVQIPGMTGLLSNLPSLSTALSNLSGGVSTFTTLLQSGFGVTESFSAAIAGLGPSMLAILGPVAAIAGLALAFRDKGENWKAQIGFGNQAQAYAVDGVFGREGFRNIAGSDELNRQIQKFFESFKGLDQRILATLSSAQESAVRTGLSSLLSNREFAFPKGDETAGEQLSLQYLQDKYKVIFGSIDTEFANFVATFHGTSADLMKSIGEMVGVLELVSGGTLKGLTIPILREWQGANETLAQSAQRVLQSWASFVDKFAPDSFKNGLILDPFVAAMHDLGVTLPGTRAGLWDYVQGLDKADANQRKIYDSIVNQYLPAADAYYNALERQAQGQSTAQKSIDDALNSLMTDAERYSQAQALLAANGITGRESLLAYITHINATSASGQEAAQRLGPLVDAFRLVGDAATQLWSDFNSLMSSRNPSFGRDGVLADRNEAAIALRNLVASTAGNAGAASLSIDDVVIRTMQLTREGFNNLTPAMQALVNTILRNQTALEGYDRTLAGLTPAVVTATNDTGAALGSLADDAIEASRKLSEAATASVAGALEALKTDAQRLAEARALLAGRGREDLIRLAQGIDPLTAAGQDAAKGLDALIAALRLVTQADTDRAAGLNAFFDSMRTDAERYAEAQELLRASGLMGSESLESVRTRLRTLADQGATLDSLRAINDAFKLVSDTARRTADATDPHATIGSDAAERAKYLADVGSLIGGLATDAERLMQAEQLLAMAGLSATSGIEDLRAELRQMASQGATIESMQALIEAFRRVGAEATARASSLDNFFSGLRTASEQLDAARSLLASAGIDARTADFESLRTRLRQLADQGATVDALQALVDAFKRVKDVATVGIDPHGSIAIGATERAKYVKDVQDLIGGLATDSERLVSAQQLLATAGIAAGASLDDLRERLRLMALAGTPIEGLQALIDAFHRVGSEADRLAQLQVDAANKAAAGIAQALANLDKLSEFREGIAGTIAGVLRGRPGYDYGGFLAGNVATARTGLGAAVGFDAQLAAAGKLRDALTNQYTFQLDALKAQQQAQATAMRSGIQSAQALGEAFRQMGDYARNMLTGELSTLSPEEQLRAAEAEYNRLEALVKMGDAKAAGQITGAADVYLKQARLYFASTGPYADIFSRVQGSLAGFGSQADAQLAAAQAMQASLDSLANALTPEMIRLQDDYITQLQGIDAQAQLWEAEQREQMHINAATYLAAATATQRVEENTRNLEPRVRDVILGLAAVKSTLDSMLRLHIDVLPATADAVAATADNTGAAATAATRAKAAL